MLFLNFTNARVAQLVERQPSKLNVAGSNPVSRSKNPKQCFGFFYGFNFNLSPKNNKPPIITPITIISIELLLTTYGANRSVNT